MNQELLTLYKKINEEEEKMLAPNADILSFYADNRAPYTSPGPLDSQSVTLTTSKPIDVYKHPRFIAFPDHAHTFMEMIYMYSGSTTQTINNSNKIVLETDDLLFLRPGTSHAIAPAGFDDIAIHIQIFPEFLSYPAEMLKDDTYLRRFLQKCIMGDTSGPDYLHFHLADIPEAKNLLENMMLLHTRDEQDCQLIMQATLGVLLMELLHRTYRITVGAPSSYEQEIVLNALSYIKDNYQTATLEKYAASIHQAPYYVSRLMKKYSPYTFTTYLQRKRLVQACHLLTSTDLPVEEISRMVGYENSSYFHRIFRKEYGMTPRHFRFNQTP